MSQQRALPWVLILIVGFIDLTGCSSSSDEAENDRSDAASSEAPSGEVRVLPTPKVGEHFTGRHAWTTLHYAFDNGTLVGTAGTPTRPMIGWFHPRLSQRIYRPTSHDNPAGDNLNRLGDELQIAWVRDADGQLHAMGFHDAEHTGEHDNFCSIIVDARANGTAIGWSKRPDREGPPVTPWFFDGRKTVRLKGSRVYALSKHGHVLGSGDNKGDWTSQYWIYHNGAYSDIGLTAKEVRTFVIGIDDHGRAVLGRENEGHGGDATIYRHDGKKLMEIGVGRGPYASNTVMNRGGYIASYFKKVVWAFDGKKKHELVIPGVAEQEKKGFPNRDITLPVEHGELYLHHDGTLIGSTEFTDYDHVDKAAHDILWLWDGKTVKVISPSGDSVQDMGYRSHELVAMNDRGLVIGATKGARKEPYHFAWLYDGQKTVRLGYRDQADEINSEALAINARGQVLGTTSHSNENRERPHWMGPRQAHTRSAWLYDPATSKTHWLPNPIPEGSSEDRRRTVHDTFRTEVNWLTDDGWVIGAHVHNGEATPFFWSIKTGLVTLEQRLAKANAEHEKIWKRLYRPEIVIKTGAMYGTGTINDETRERWNVRTGRFPYEMTLSEPTR